MVILGIVVKIISIERWKENGFGELNSNLFMPTVILANLLLTIGVELIFSSFIINVMKDVSSTY